MSTLRDTMMSVGGRIGILRDAQYTGASIQIKLFSQ